MNCNEQADSRKKNTINYWNASNYLYNLIPAEKFPTANNSLLAVK